MSPKCRECGVELVVDENWPQSFKKRYQHICRKCNTEQYRLWKKANPDKVKANKIRFQRKRGVRPYNENKECAAYLGVHIAERVLSHVFKNVKRMPYGNPGYDVICNRNKLIDIKSSCRRKGRWQGWRFIINHNTTADYFLCLAFDNREDLNPLHAWLLPGSKFNHLMDVSISDATIDKWGSYQIDISKVVACCNVLKET